jgi:hypothetical protein
MGFLFISVPMSRLPGFNEFQPVLPLASGYIPPLFAA